jgi:hypothetical protein
MDRIQATLFLLVLMGIGWVRLLLDYRKLKQRRAFVDEYFDKFNQFANTYYMERRINQELYSWLTYKVTRIQSELGDYGVLAAYRPAFANYMLQDYPIIINTLPGMVRGTAYQSDVGTCIESLMRYMGAMDEGLDDFARQLRNPFIWLREGVRFITLLPILILHWSGLVGPSFVRRISNSALIKIISGSIVIVGLISSIVTIVLGWEQFINVTQSLLRKVIK